LIDQKRLFSDEQLENIYRSLEFTKEINDCLTYDYEKELDSLMRHIEKILPYVSQGKQQYSVKDSRLPLNEFIVQHKVLDEACRQWCDFINEAPERQDGIGFTEFYEEICRQKYSEYIDEMEYDQEQGMQLNM
jgi:uncharacterized membrane-anchored protein YjiN (DUF445 family)